jgi:OOP family OmpA-OmpF porin
VKNKENAKKESGQAQQAYGDSRAGNDAYSGQGQPSLETFSKYDFIPGEKVIFFEDLSQDALGDFPAPWNTNGSAEVVSTNLYPGKWMKFSGRESIWTDQSLDLPENYTVEFDVIPTRGENNSMEGSGFES